MSKKNVHHPKSKDNSALFEEGALFAAKFLSDGTGQWIPVALNSPVNPAVPSELGSAELAALGSISRDGNTRFPKRNGVAGQTSDGGPLTVLISGITSPAALTEAQVIESYKTRGGTKSAATLADYYTSQGAILCDAVLAANLAGGTPCARPEDIEVNPHNAREVFIAFTDGAPGSDGYPDSRIFQVSKTSKEVNGTQQSGGLYKISENSVDSTGTTFKWSKLEQGGEAGSDGGSGFAAIDNLVFDKKGHVWCVTDMSTGFHNGFIEGNPSAPTTIDHSITGDVSALVGVFGANWLFVIPTSGKEAGEVIPFAYGPVRCEMTGPTFVGNTLILAVQHPCEDVLIEPVKLERDIEMLDLDGTLFEQKRIVPGGSNWPSNIEGDESGPPRPSVIGIIRKDPRGSFF